MIQKAVVLVAVLLPAFLALPRTVDSQVTVIEGREITPAGASPVGNTGKIYQLSVTPAEQADPPLRYRFTVEPHRTIAGNAATHYLRSQGENSLDGPFKFIREQVDENALSWISSETKTEEIPLDKLREAAGSLKAYIANHMKRATICRETDWGIVAEDLRGREVIELLLPSVQPTRTMARAMLLQHRLAIIDGRYEDAIENLRMTYQLGQNVSKMGFLVTSLVGAAEVSMANDGALLLLCSDNAPNLYWALAELPTPIIDLRGPMRLEASLPLRLFPELIGIDQAVYSDEGWKRLFERYTSEFSYFQKVMGGNFDSKPAPANPAFSFAAALSGYSSAKKRMLDRGYDIADVKAMSVSQLLLVDAAQDIKYFSQMQERALYLPFDKATALYQATEKVMQEQSVSRFGALIATTFSPAARQIRTSATRVQAEINVLMAIESLRNHAAVNGEFPDSLETLELPVRENPFTGRPFNYSLENGKAVLTFDSGNGRIRRFEIETRN